MSWIDILYNYKVIYKLSKIEIVSDSLDISENAKTLKSYIFVRFKAIIITKGSLEIS